MAALACRSCGAALEHSLVDLGSSPLANAFLPAGELGRPEPAYPLHVRVCGSCMLAQLPQLESAENIFSHYVYFSSYSESWLDHAGQFAREAIARHRLGASSLVVEVGSNDGYLLQFFARAGVAVLGVEPAANVARAAEAKGVRTRVAFFGLQTAKAIVAGEGQADLVVGNNVLAHVPDLNDFIAGLALLLKPAGVLTMEFPHLLRLIEEGQFDTIYHEHFCYFSLLSAEPAFERHGLKLFDVETLPTHGGSLRVHFAPAAAGRAASAAVIALRRLEKEKGLDRIETYAGFAARPRRVRERLLALLAAARREGKRVAAYGAAAKGNTLLNYCGIGADAIEYVVDRNPHKQGLYLPGSHIPVVGPERLRETRPDVLLLLPWNLLDELLGQLAFVREWGGQFLVPIPEPRLLP
jgi:SAM-dependent methyltransferase